MEAARAQQYDAMAMHHAARTCADRKDVGTSSVRYMNNFVKACMIDTACRVMTARLPDTRASGLVIADIACGRGQDAAKWKFGAEAAGTHIRSYYGMDLASHDCGAAATIAARFLPAAVRHIHPANMGSDMFELPDAAAHIVSCQLALHYICDARAHVAHFFAQAARVLHPNGLLLVSFADGRAVVRRGRNAADAAGTVRAPFYKLTVPAALLKPRLASAFGNMYVFTLDNSVEGVPEYLCHEGAISAVAQAEAGFVPLLSKSFDELARFLRERPRFQSIAQKMDGSGFEHAASLPATLDAANLYRFIAFSKQRSSSAAQDFNAHLMR